MTTTSLRYRATGMYGVGKPAALTGRPYLGINTGGGLNAWLYRGGTFSEVLATTVTGDPESLGHVAVVNLHAPVVIALQTTSGQAADRIYVWNIDTNGLVTINRTPGTLHGAADYQVAPALTGATTGHGYFYWVEYESEEQLFWLMRGSMGGGVEQITPEADGEVTSPTEFVNDFGGFLSRDAADEAVFIPNWGGGSPLQSGYIRLPLDGGPAERVVDTAWLPDITVGVNEWEHGHGTNRRKALLVYDGASATRIVYKWTLAGGLVPIVGAAHGLGDFNDYQVSESIGGDVVLYVNDSGTRQIARVAGAGIADPPTETIAWTTVGTGPNGQHPDWMFALD